MAKKKSKSFGKHIYALVAIVVLLVAAGIASYATAPPGAATHGTLYTNTIFIKNRPPSYQVIDINDTVYGNKGIRGISNYNVGVGGISNLDSTSDGGANGVFGQATQTNGVGVKGENSVSGNKGFLGTAMAGVEGIGNVGISTVFGVKGVSSGSTASSAGVYGETSGLSAAGVRGYATGIDGAGVRGAATSATGWGGWFTGGRGLFAEKIEFGASAFDESDASGLLVIATKTAGPCSTICSKHGLSCFTAFATTGTELSGTACTSGFSPKYCWCGQA